MVSEFHGKETSSLKIEASRSSVTLKYTNDITPSYSREEDDPNIQTTKTWKFTFFVVIYKDFEILFTFVQIGAAAYAVTLNAEFRI